MSDVKEMTLADVDQMMALVHYAFQWELSEKNRQRFQMLAENSWNFGSFDDKGQLASQVMATPFSVDLFGDTHLMVGVGFVASYPEYRSQGRIDQIMTQLLATARERGANLSYLAPFSYPFYRRYGYELIFERAVYDVPANQWPDSAKVPGTLRRLDWQEAKPIISELFPKAQRHHQGGVQRDSWWLDFKFPLRKDYQYAIYYDANGNPQGYLVYLLQPGLMTIAEWTWLSGEAFRGLNRFVASHSGSVARIFYEMGYDGKNLQFLTQIPLQDFRVRPEMMARVVDVASFLKDTKKVADLPASLALEIVEDRYAPWNNGLFELQKGEQGVTIAKVATTQLPKVSLTIQRFSQLFMGYLTPETLAFHDLIEVDKKTLKSLKAILPDQKPILEDYF